MNPGCAEGAAFRFQIARNCSVAPHRLFALFLAVASIPLIIALGFAFFGAWPVLPFAGLELAGLALAFLWHARHAGDCECIALQACCLQVELREARRSLRHEFNPLWVQVITDSAGRRLLLRSYGRDLEIGRHLDADGRRRLGLELMRRLGELRSGAGARRDSS